MQAYGQNFVAGHQFGVVQGTNKQSGSTELLEGWFTPNVNS